mgnify:CR=1 FL=1
MICGSCGESLQQDLDHHGPCPVCNGEILLEGRYQLDKVIGQGASGITYQGQRLEDGHQVAIKELPFRRLDSMKTKALFEREARILRQLKHPGIPTYLDDFTGGHGKNLSLYLVQEYIDGPTLHQEMDTQRYTEAEVLEIVTEVLHILQYLHTLRPAVIHRDIKPRNIMRRSDGALVLVDFGAVRDAVKDPDAGGSTVAGTFGYMAPEQFQGLATPATDIYGLGALAVSLLTRRSPDKMLGAGNQLDWEPHAQDTSKAVRQLLRDMLQQDPQKRPSDAQKLQERIADLLTTPDPSTALAPVFAPNGPPMHLRAQNAAPTPPSRPTSPSHTRRPPEEHVPSALALLNEPQVDDSQETNSGLLWIPLIVVAMVGVLALVVSNTQHEPDLYDPVTDPFIKVAEPEVMHAGSDRCDGPCPPVARGLKGLKFGMSIDEIRSAMPEMKDAKPLPELTVRPEINPMDLSNFDLISKAAQTIPGERFEVRTTIGQFAASCTLGLHDNLTLSIMTCTLDGAGTISGHNTIESTLLQTLTERYKAPNSANTPSDETIVGLSRDRDWRWEDDGARLTLSSDFKDLGSTIGIKMEPTSTIVLNNVSAEHDKVMREAKVTAQKRMQKLEKEAQAAKEKAAQEEMERLKNLRNDNGGLKDDL